jgi:hypothetical protein
MHIDMENTKIIDLHMHIQERKVQTKFPNFEIKYSVDSASSHKGFQIQWDPIRSQSQYNPGLSQQKSPILSLIEREKERMVNLASPR